MKSESAIQAEIMLAVGAHPDVKLFRNTVGFGFQGDVVSNSGGVVVLRNARPVTFGLAVGSHDLIAVRSVVITPRMVGRRVGLFGGIEVKRPGEDRSADQDTFHTVMVAAGAITGVARNVTDAKRLLVLE